MNIQEVLRLQANQRRTKEGEEAKTRSEEEAALLASDAEWARKRPALQALLEKETVEYISNLQLIKDASAEAVTYIQPVLEQVRRQLAHKFPIVQVSSPSLQIDGLRDPHMMGIIVNPEGPRLEEFKEHITPATYLVGQLTAGMVWGNTYPEKKYSHFIRGEFVKQDSSEFNIRVELDEVHLSWFGRLSIEADGFEGNSQISFLDWYKKPHIVQAAIHKAILHPKVIKYDSPYEAPVAGPLW